MIKLEIVSEYDQEIPYSQTAEKHMAQRGRATQPPEYQIKRNLTVKPWWAQLQTQHQALSLSSIDKSLSPNG